MPSNNLPPDESREDRVLNTHVWGAVPDPELRPLDLPIVHWPITVVLLGGALGDYAAYVGIGSARWVGMHGTKLTFDQARAFFPLIEAELYRA